MPSGCACVHVMTLKIQHCSVLFRRRIQLAGTVPSYNKCTDLQTAVDRHHQFTIPVLRAAQAKQAVPTHTDLGVVRLGAPTTAAEVHDRPPAAPAPSASLA